MADLDKMFEALLSSGADEPQKKRRKCDGKEGKDKSKNLNASKKTANAEGKDKLKATKVKDVNAKETGDASGKDKE